MRSSELARLAGVTVRTLRHYHQIGLLAEPERRHNGYRSYDVHDLIRVVRIRRLASVGIPLERMPGLLDDEADDAGLLDELDAELAAQIQRLTEQRAVLARLRAHGAAPDLPPELAPFLAAFASADLSPELVRMDRDQSILLAHLAGHDGMPELTRFYERISASDVAPAIADFAKRFDALDEASSEGEIDELVNRFVTVLVPLLPEFSDPAAPVAPPASADLLGAYTDDKLSGPQRVALDRLGARLEGMAGTE